MGAETLGQRQRLAVVARVVDAPGAEGDRGLRGVERHALQPVAHDEHVGARQRRQVRGDGAIAIEHVVGHAPERHRVEPRRHRREHRRRMRDADHVREHAAVLGARERLHAVVGQHRIAVAVPGVAGGAGAARAARDLEGDDRALPDLQAGHRIPERDDLSDALVPERERSTRREQARGEEEVDVAARDGEGTDEGLAVPLEPRLRHVTPFDGVGADARELSHARQLSSGAHPWQTISPHARLRVVQPLV